ncbi:MAG: succinyl-diaminopimelate desuccinylase [Microthrixaceae bacterium]
MSGTASSVDPAAVDEAWRRTCELVDIESVSFAEGPIVARIEAELGAMAHLEVTRVGDNLVARTTRGRRHRLVMAGHTDTVPVNGNHPGRLEPDHPDGPRLRGVGSADMKSGLAVMLTSAGRHCDAEVDLTYVFYAREEVAAADSGLGELIAARADLLAGDLAVLGEPTDGAVEAGCQGSIRAEVVLRGVRAHTARAWKGVNAVHRAAPVLGALGAYRPRRPMIAGCRFHEAMLCVGITGGVSGNVVPDEVTLTVAHRFAPDRDLATAEAHLREVLEVHLHDEDELRIVDRASAASPAVDHPWVKALIDRRGLDVAAKLGWTDVARFAELGIPAVNLGPGDATVAHTQGEFVTRDSVARTWSAMDDLVHIASGAAHAAGNA